MTTGRFTTRAELEEWVRHNYYNTPANMADIARQCRVSTTTVSKILNKGLKPCTSQTQTTGITPNGALPAIASSSCS